MASSGSFKTGNYEGRYLVFAWEVSSQSTENNKTKISWSLKGAGEASAGWYYAQNIKVIIAGETVFNDYTNPGGGDQLKLYNGTTVATGTYTFTHDSNGEKSFSASAEAGIYNWAVNCKGSGSWDLPTIARASTLTSAANVTLGNACSVKWTPKSASFRYKLKFSMGDWSYTTGAIHPGTTSAYTYTGYTIPLEAAEQIPSKTSGSMTVALYTYSDSGCKKQVGDASSKTFTVTVPNNSSTKPSISIDNLSPVSSLGSGFDGLYVQGKSKVKAEFTGSGKYGATISKYTMTVDGKSYGSSQNYTSNYFSNYGQFDVKISVEDSRGFTNSATKNITVIPYSNPKVDVLICQRCDADGNLDDSGTYLKIKATRKYSKVMSGDVQKNYCQIRYRYKSNAASSYSSWSTILESDSESDEVITGALLSGNLAVNTSYMVQVHAIDDIGENGYTTITIPTDKVFMHRDGARRSIAIGGYIEEDNTFSTAEDIDFKIKKDSLHIAGQQIQDFVIETGETGIWKYRKWKSGYAELWGYKWVGTILESEFAQWGPLYIGAIDSEDFPFQFTEIPVVVREVVNPQGSGFTVAYYTSKDSTGKTDYVIPSAETVNELRIRYYAFGKWK